MKKRITILTLIAALSASTTAFAAPISRESAPLNVTKNQIQEYEKQLWQIRQTAMVTVYYHQSHRTQSALCVIDSYGLTHTSNFRLIPVTEIFQLLKMKNLQQQENYY